jgi:anti-anti-sigma regulatory factor
MRDHGLVESAAGFGLNGHACWVYEDDEELIRGASEFLVAGERLGQRLIFVGPSLPEALSGHAVDFVPLGDVYGSDPETLLAYYSAATDAALADGYTGLRAVGMVSELMQDRRVWEQHRVWEGLADRYMAHKPLAGLCCYDRRMVPDELISDLCAIHPAVHPCGHPVPFRVYHDEHAVVLDGELDYFAAERARRALAATAREGDVLDLSRLRFVDHNGAVALLDSSAALRGIPKAMRRVLDLRGLET